MTAKSCQYVEKNFNKNSNFFAHKVDLKDAKSAKKIKKNCKKSVVLTKIQKIFLKKGEK